jgi:N6-L-threonylcarbamoyladenine synthase
MYVLGIETSCDETAAAIVEDGSTIMSNVIASQVEIHARYGGIVPEVASRQHMLSILPVIEQALSIAQITWRNIAALAVTNGPGLAGSLLVGVNIAKAVCLAHYIPLIGINHLEAHIYANWLSHQNPVFPCLCLIVSGGHSDLILMSAHGQYRKIGQTRDDAAGEAFDKGARIIGLGYPGGPAIQNAAKNGTPSISLPRAWLKDSDDFSFSGLKTALLNLVQSSNNSVLGSTADLASSYQQAIVDVLIGKTIQVAKRLDVKQILLAGGVAANSALCEHFLQTSPIPVSIPPPGLCTDNAAMVAACGFYHFELGNISSNTMDVLPSLSF